MDNFDKNQVDKELLEKVDEVLNGKADTEVPDLVFSEEIPKDYDISQDLNEGMQESMNAASAAAGGFDVDVERPDAGFNYNAPEAPDFGGYVQSDNAQQQSGWNGEVPQSGATWQDLKDKRNPKKEKTSLFAPGTSAIIGLIFGVLAVAVSIVSGFKMAIGGLPLILGLYFSKAGLNSEKRTLALAGMVLNAIGVVLLIFAIVRNLI